MKTFIATFLVLFLSLPTASTAEEGTADGKGIYCATAPTLGWWFDGGLVTPYSVSKFKIQTGDSSRYYEPDWHTLNLGKHSRTLDRQTLILKNENDNSTYRCILVNSFEELTQKIQDQIDAAKAKNKI
tara:strand:- start:171 stop:554 length:384 start_codon:yes stop_codon:yes gene_type:complete